jgi:hypothetical protein
VRRHLHVVRPQELGEDVLTLLHTQRTDLLCRRLSEAAVGAVDGLNNAIVVRALHALADGARRRNNRLACARVRGLVPGRTLHHEVDELEDGADTCNKSVDSVVCQRLSRGPHYLSHMARAETKKGEGVGLNAHHLMRLLFGCSTPPMPPFEDVLPTAHARADGVAPAASEVVRQSMKRFS